MTSRKTRNVAALVGGNISSRRKLMRYTQADLAEQLKMGPDSLSRIENGIVAPRLERLADIAAALDCSMADLFSMEKAPLSVNLDTVAEMLRPLPAVTQEDLVYLMITAIQTVKRNRVDP